jgi:hypothetical protein
MTIYQASPPPWRTGDRTIQTFPSGLLRVDHTYVVPTADISSHYAAFAAGQPLTDTSAPAIDGLFVFPDPTINEAGDGLSQINVSGYGRTSSDLRDITLTQITFPINSSIRFKAWEVRGRVVLPTGTPLTIDSVTTQPEWLEPFDVFYLSDDWILQSLGQGSISYRSVAAASATAGESRNYALPVRAYRATMLNTVTMQSANFVFTLRDPVWTIENQNSFGAFVEMSIVGDRGELSTATI